MLHPKQKGGEIYSSFGAVWVVEEGWVWRSGGGGGFMHGHNPAPKGRPPLPAASHN